MNAFIEKCLKEHEEENLDSRTSWEMLKASIRTECMEFGKNKRLKEKQLDAHALETNLKNIAKKIADDPNDIELQKQYATCKKSLETEQLAKTRGAIVRARVKWTEEGEKNTKYFLSLEQKRAASNTIKQIQSDQGEIFRDPNDILTETKKYYEKLYTSDNPSHSVEEEVKHFLNGSTYNKLSEVDRDLCDTPLNLAELGAALKLLKNDSSPGSDGITAGFYKMFWQKLKLPLFKSLQNSIEIGELSTSQRRGIINLIHKGNNTNRYELKNWRPITLTNVDYKIFTKLLAVRLQKIIKTIIHENQSGFIKGRNISSHIRLIDDIIRFADREQLDGLVVSLDYQKAFDTVEKKTIIAALKCFNFGAQFTKFIETILKNTQSAVKNGGWLSNWFTTSRGVRQGCCVSPLLFVLVVELLAIKIRKRDDIKGVLRDSVLQDNLKLLQYADDMTLLLKNEADLNVCLGEIDTFSKISGLKLNKKKSVGLWIGQSKNNPEGEEGISWAKVENNIKILGIYFNANLEASKIPHNWTGKVEDIKLSVQRWSKRNLSLYGKVIITKTFILSKINFIIQSLSLPQEVLAQIDSIIFTFLWKKKYSNRKAFEKIKRNNLCKDAADGGLSAISVKDQQNTFLLRWLDKACKDVLEGNTQGKVIDSLCRSLGSFTYLTEATVKAKEVKEIQLVKSKFWRDIVITWLDFDKGPHLMDFESEEYKIRNQPLFYNNEVRFKNKPLLIKKWIKGGIRFVCQMLTGNAWKSIDDVRHEIGDYPGLCFDYLAVTNAVKREWKDTLLNDNIGNIESEQHNADKISETAQNIFKHTNKEIRSFFINSKNTTVCSIGFWKRKYNIDIQNYFVTAMTASKESRLRLLHFKILHNIYPTNILLSKMKIKTSDKCEYCKTHDFIEHFFFHCKRLDGFWKCVEQYIFLKTERKIIIDEKVALFGVLGCDLHESKGTTANNINMVLLVAKMCISKVKYGIARSPKVVFETEMAVREKYIN